MIKIAICDDDLIFCFSLETIILNRYSFHEIEIEIFEKGEILYESLKNGIFFDLIFLDIEMVGFDGITTGLKIRNDLENETIQIVYISSKENYYRLLFEVRPNNFLLKPVNEEDVVKEIEKAKRLSIKFNEKFIYKKFSEVYTVLTKEILYFESMDKKIRIVTVNGEDIFYGKLKEVMNMLKGLTFFQIHKSFFVNMTHVTLFRYEELVLSNGEVLGISQSKRKAVRLKQKELIEGAVYGK